MAKEDPDTLKALQDSIQHRLDHYADNLWVPSREELQKAREAAEANPGDSTNIPVEVLPVRSTRSRSERASTRSRETKKPKARAAKKPKSTPSPSTPSSSASRSVRNRRK